MRVLLGVISVAFLVIVVPMNFNRAEAAACPLTLSHFRYVGQSSNGVYSVFRFDAVTPKKIPIAAHITAVDSASKAVVYNVPRFTPIVAGGNGTNAILVSSDPNLETLAVADTQINGEADYAPCTGLEARLADGDPPVITIFTDPSTGQVDTSTVMIPADPALKEGDFVFKAMPAYPGNLQNANIQGRVIVVADIASDGPPRAVSLFDSSQSAGLDLDGASAAAHSKFKAARENGTVLERWYKIEYDFTLVDTVNPSPFYYPPSPPRWVSACHVQIGHAWLEGFDNSNNDNLYSLRLDSDTDNIGSVSFVIDGQAMVANVESLKWTREDDGWYSAGAALLRSGSLVKSVSLSTATELKTGRALRCNSSPAVVWANPVTQVSEPADLPPSGDATVVAQAAFQTQVRPVYPPTSAEKGNEGQTVLVIGADQAGKPVSARIFVSSGFADLDQAAMKAAWSSSYRPTGQLATYWLTYRFLNWEHLPRSDFNLLTIGEER